MNPSKASRVLTLLGLHLFHLLFQLHPSLKPYEIDRPIENFDPSNGPLQFTRTQRIRSPSGIDRSCQVFVKSPQWAMQDSLVKGPACQVFVERSQRPEQINTKYAQCFCLIPILRSVGEEGKYQLHIGIGDAMDLTPFKLDIDELLNEFVECGSTTLADMKQVWLSRKFSYIFEARPTTNLAFFMQSLYAHALSHLVPTGSLSRRLGAFYCLYCLYETQPFKPPFKIYLSLGELRRLRDLVVEAKQNSIRVLSALVKRMMDRNMFLFGSVDINDSAITERINEITKLQNVGVQIASERLFANTRIEERLHMDLGAELDLQVLKKMSTEYEKAKELTIKEASNFVGMEDIKHIAESRNIVGDATVKISEEWDAQKELFYQRTGTKNPHEESEATEFDKELEHLLTDC